MPTQEREETSQPIRERGREGERERGNTTLKQTKREPRERESAQTPPNDTREGGGEATQPPQEGKTPAHQYEREKERERERERETEGQEATQATEESV